MGTLALKASVFFLHMKTREKAKQGLNKARTRHNMMGKEKQDQTENKTRQGQKQYYDNKSKGNYYTQ